MTTDECANGGVGRLADVVAELRNDHATRAQSGDEAARAALSYGFFQLALSEIVSMTVPEHRASRRVMERLLAE